MVVLDLLFFFLSDLLFRVATKLGFIEREICRRGDARISVGEVGPTKGPTGRILVWLYSGLHLKC